jgi:hypothetical protein
VEQEIKSVQDSAATAEVLNFISVSLLYGRCFALAGAVQSVA